MYNNTIGYIFFDSMGNLFCDCTRKAETPSRPDDNIPDFKESPTIQNKIISHTKAKTEIDGFSKKTTMNEIWNNLEQSSIIGKGKGNPRDKYQFMEQIGAGTFGVVYKAKIKKTGELRAIKIIKKQKDSIAYEKNIIREIELLESIDHPNIIKIYEFYDCPEYICIVSELGKGGSLANNLNTILNESETVKALIMFQLLSAVNYCHSMKIMHRDLKPENILIEQKTSNGIYNIKLIDFGTAKFVINVQTQITGSPHFIAPEVLNAKYTEKCDLWSIGVILYVLFKGAYPFEGKSRAQIFEHIKQGKYDLKSKPFDRVSSKAKDLIQKLLKVDPTERISASRALDHGWFTSLKIKEQLFDLDIEVAKKLLNNIYNYSTSNRLQKPVIAYLVHNHGDKNKFVKAATTLFTKIDINNNGALERGEFIKNTKELYKQYNQKVDEHYLGSLFDKIDSDNSRQIGYREFVCAAVDKKVFLGEEMLKDAFNFFDRDKSGSITLDELKKAFSSFKGYKTRDFTKILKEIDINNDSKIDFIEFQQMMRKIIE